MTSLLGPGLPLEKSVAHAAAVAVLAGELEIFLALTFEMKGLFVTFGAEVAKPCANSSQH